MHRGPHPILTVILLTAIVINSGVANAIAVGPIVAQSLPAHVSLFQKEAVPPFLLFPLNHSLLITRRTFGQILKRHAELKSLLRGQSRWMEGRVIWVGAGGSDKSNQSASDNLLNHNQSVINAFNARQGTKAVDFGSGFNPLFLTNYQKKHPDHFIIGFDPLVQLEPDETWKHMPANLVFRDAAETGLESASVDQVTWNMPDPRTLPELAPKLMKEAFRILKPGGTLLVVVEKAAKEDSLGSLLLRGDIDDLVSAIQSADFLLQSHAVPLQQFDAEYPRTRMIDAYMQKDGCEVFIGRKPDPAAARKAFTHPNFSPMRELFTLSDQRLYFPFPKRLIEIRGPQMGRRAGLPFRRYAEAAALIPALAVGSYGHFYEDLAAFLARPRGVSFSRDLKGAKVLVIGPKTGADVFQLLARYPGISELHMLTPDPAVFDSVEMWAHAWDLMGAGPLPKFFGYPTTVMEMPRQVLGQMDLVITANISVFSNVDAKSWGAEIPRALKLAGVYILFMKATFENSMKIIYTNWTNTFNAYLKIVVTKKPLEWHHHLSFDRLTHQSS